MNKLVLRAGKTAYQKIKEKGLSPEDIYGVVAAAGGPKWFTTYGLVRYLLADFLLSADQELHFLGASVGSWQMATALAKEPGEALDRLRHAYASSQYASDSPSRAEISEVCHQIIKASIDGDLDHILSHKTRSLTIITARGKGWLAADSDIKKGMGFAFGFLSNAIRRQHLNKVSERVVLHHGNELIYNEDQDIIATTKVKLDRSNLIPALRASGTIPYMMQPLKDLPGAPSGTYWDGGFTDYHISLPYKRGIVLHPHFLPYVLQGWMDKKLPYQRAAPAALMDHVLLITPSNSYIETLPRKQISDMKDFKFYGLDQDTRTRYWLEISNRSLELGEELRDLCRTGKIAEVIQPY